MIIQRLIEFIGGEAEIGQVDIEVDLTEDQVVGTIARDRVAEVNKRLVEGGVDVLSLIPREASLEDFFLELTGGASGDRAPGSAARSGTSA